ncbi:M48 family metalloprotease [Bariatricus sp. HCP3S3_E12]|uniref:M48 family metalloprotease n=1 Tax=Bariatricus sp. HCP3S3_E12 TaxID=3438906 RepID=UPI003F8B2625
MKRKYDLVKASILLIVNFIVFGLLGIEWAIGITAIIAFISYLGEFSSLVKDQAIPLRNMDTYYQAKLDSAFQILCQQGVNVGINLKHLRLYMLPNDDQINAYSYGFTHVGVTKGLLALDEVSIAAVLAHESGHCLQAHGFIKRILFCDTTIVMLLLSGMGIISTGFVWMIFGLLCFGGVCGGVLSFYMTGIIGKIIRGIFRGFQHIVLFIYQITLGFVSRSMEYSADRFAAKKLDFGNELSFFLNRFAVEDGYPKTLRDIMYASHPVPYKRIAKIEQYGYTTLPLDR